MKPTLQFRLSQHLTLTPQLQQSIRLLQLSTVELNQEIERLLMENPALEREDAEGGGAAESPGAGETPAPAAEAAEATAPEGDWSPGLAPATRTADDEETDRHAATPDLPSLRDHLRAQLSLVNIDERDRAFVALLIDALDEDGYLTQPLEEISALLGAESEAGME